MCPRARPRCCRVTLYFRILGSGECFTRLECLEALSRNDAKGILWTFFFRPNTLPQPPHRTGSRRGVRGVKRVVATHAVSASWVEKLALLFCVDESCCAGHRRRLCVGWTKSAMTTRRVSTSWPPSTSLRREHGLAWGESKPCPVDNHLRHTVPFQHLLLLAWRTINAVVAKVAIRAMVVNAMFVFHCGRKNICNVRWP